MSHHQPSPGPSQPFQPAKQKSKAHPPVGGIAAGAEDAKYHAKYKELKRKVKEIETDNDKLQFKVLQAKRSIQRMRLERSILYERLAMVPPSPDIRDRKVLPPDYPGPAGVPHHQLLGSHGTQQYRETHGYAQPVDQNDPVLIDYLRTHRNVSVLAGPDGRPIPLPETPVGPGVAPVSHVPPGSRHNHGQGLDDSRQLPPLSQLAHYEQPLAPGHHPHSYTSARTHPSSTHERTRSSQSSQHHTYQQPPFPTDIFPPVRQPSRSSDRVREKEKSRRHDLHEQNNPHGDGRPHPHLNVSSQSMPSTPLNVASPTESRGHSHSHHRLPAASARGDEREFDREHEWEREREREHDFARDRHAVSSVRMHSPPPSGNVRSTIPPDYHSRPPSRPREDPSYNAGNYSRPSRSGTPGSGYGEGRPEGTYYDRERTRYSAPPGAQSNEDIDWVPEDGRTRGYDRGGGGGGVDSRPAMTSRKRSRHDMEVDDENVERLPGEPGRGSGGRFSHDHPIDDRGSRRYLQVASTSSIRGGHEGEDEDTE